MNAMNRFAAFLALGLLAMPLAALADSKLGWVDMQRALEEIDEGKVAKAQLKKDFEEKQKQLDAKQSELEALRTDFEKQQAVLSDQVKQTKAAEIEKRFGEVRQFYVQLQQDLAAREQEASKGITERMNGLVREIAEAEGLQAVLDGGAVVWAAPSLDLTNEVIRKYNAKFPLKGDGAKLDPKAAPKPPAAKPATKK
jgi:outer membrane protein